MLTNENSVCLSVRVARLQPRDLASETTVTSEGTICILKQMTARRSWRLDLWVASRQSYRVRQATSMLQPLQEKPKEGNLFTAQASLLFTPEAEIRNHRKSYDSKCLLSRVNNIPFKRAYPRQLPTFDSRTKPA